MAKCMHQKACTHRISMPVLDFPSDGHSYDGIEIPTAMRNYNPLQRWNSLSKRGYRISHTIFHTVNSAFRYCQTPT